VIASFLDAEVPVALDGGLLTHRIVAEADGKPPYQEADRRQRDLRELWSRVTGVGMTDEEFVATGTVANEFLDELDRNFAALALGEEELRKKPPPTDVDLGALASAYARWDNQLSDEERLGELRRYVAKSWRLSALAAERLDAHVCTTAYRLQAAARGARTPKKNDGADVSLTIHLGSGCILLTNDLRLIDVVDHSGTFQAPWVRHPDDLDNLPEGMPWGDVAKLTGTSFRRCK
jgi:hypothetical protein